MDIQIATVYSSSGKKRSIVLPNGIKTIRQEWSETAERVQILSYYYYCYYSISHISNRITLIDRSNRIEAVRLSWGTGL